MNTKEFDLLVEKLDQFIEENLEIKEPDFNALHSGGGIEKKLDRFMEEMRGKPEEEGNVYFAKMVNTMREELGLTEPELYKMALSSRGHWSKLMGPERPHPGKGKVIAYALALIRTDVRKNKPPKMSPEERMDTLLMSGGGVDYKLKNSSHSDVIIKFCLKEKIYDVDVVNNLLTVKNCLILSKYK